MKSERVYLKVGTRYNLVNHSEKNLLVIRTCPDDSYSPFTAVVRSDTTGWTMKVHGTNQYEDGSIDWDYSTDGYFSILKEDQP